MQILDKAPGLRLHLLVLKLSPQVPTPLRVRARYKDLKLTTPFLRRLAADTTPSLLPISGWRNSPVARPRPTYLETVFDERLGVEKTMKQHLTRCHRHLQTREENGSAGVRRARTRRRRHFVPLLTPLPLPTANSARAVLPPHAPSRAPAAGEARGRPPRGGPWWYREAAEGKAGRGGAPVGPGPEH